MKLFVCFVLLFATVKCGDPSTDQRSSSSNFDDGNNKSYIKRGSEQQIGSYQTGFTPIYTNNQQNYGQYSNYGPYALQSQQQPVYAASAVSPQVYLAKVAQPQAAYSALQYAPIGQKFAYAGPQVTFAPQQLTKQISFVPSQPAPIVQAYAPIQQQNYVQPQQQQQHQPYIPTTGPIAYQNGYAFIPMDAITLGVQTPSLQNQGIITHTQAFAPQGTHGAPLHYIIPHGVATAAAKTITPVYTSYQTSHQYPQQHQPLPAYASFIPQQHQQQQQQQPQQIQLTQVKAAASSHIVAPTAAAPNTHYKHFIAATATQTTHPNNGAISFSSFQHHLNPTQQTLVSPVKTISAPIIQQQPVVYAAATAPIHSYTPAYGKSLQYQPAHFAVAPSAAVYTQHPPHHEAIHYGTHLYQPSNGFARINYGAPPKYA